jgi:hypothetical protein
MEPKQKHTDKKLLSKGLKLLVFSIVMIVVTTYLFTFTFLNKEVLPMYLLLPLAIISMGATIYLIFQGIRTLVKALF